MSTANPNLRQKSDVSKGQLWAPTMIAGAFFVPGHLFEWTFEYLWLAVQLMVLFIFWISNGKTLQPTAGVQPTVWIYVFLAITISGIISTFYGYTALSIQPEPADAFDLLRFAISIPLVIFFGTMLTSNNINKVVNVIKICILFNLLCSLILIYNISPLSDILITVYEDAKIQFDDNYIRVGIPFANPNFAAYIFVLLLSFFLFFERSILFSFLLIVSIFLTGSRSGYLAAFPLIFLAYCQIMTVSLKNLKYASLFIITNAALFSLAYSTEIFFGTFNRVNELADAYIWGDFSEVDSAAVRLNVISDATAYIASSPILGVGPGRSLGFDVVDSQLVAWPLNLGIPAALVLYIIFSAPLLQLAIRAPDLGQKLAALVTGLSFFMMLGAGDFLKNFRLFYLTLAILHCLHISAFYSGSLNRKE